MSEFHVTVARVGQISKHPNADTLSIARVFDYTVVIRTGDYAEGDLAVYIPIDSVLPDTEQWHFLSRSNDGTFKYNVGEVPQKYRVVEAKRLRGIFSQGMLAKLPVPHLKEGDDVRELMRIEKYEPPADMSTFGESEAPPVGWVIPTYTDIEGLRRNPNILVKGEEVVITEKIHGCNGRFVHDGIRLWAGSRTQIRRFDPKSVWWATAEKLELSSKLSRFPFFVFYGEVYGQVQDLKYGIKSGVDFRVFDVFDTRSGRYVNHDAAVSIAEECMLTWVPILYRGPWCVELNDMCEGNTTLTVDCHVREGIVVKPVEERYNSEIGRVILKRHGEGYLLRKKK